MKERTDREKWKDWCCNISEPMQNLINLFSCSSYQWDYQQKKDRLLVVPLDKIKKFKYFCGICKGCVEFDSIEKLQTHAEAEHIKKEYLGSLEITLDIM